MNKTEAQFARRLSLLQKAGEITWWRYEPVSIRLAHMTFYRPDFAVVEKNGELAFYEVKGFWRDDARVKIKVAAETFPADFYVVTGSEAKGWKIEKV